MDNRDKKRYYTDSEKMEELLFMGLTLAEKIIQEHIADGSMEKGKEVGLRIDQTLTQDATGTMVYLQFESMKVPRIKTELSLSYVDHNTLQSDFRNMDDHLYLQDTAKKYGIHFSRPGNGICHQVHRERFGIPGKTLLGSDSHTPTGGGLGMIAVGAGGLDVAAAMAGEPFYFTLPEIVGVHLKGTLQRMCSAKDIILKILELETVKGGIGKIYEYYGEGVKHLSVPERCTITNMGAELGATTSLFPSDDITKDYLYTQRRPEDFRALNADSDAVYARILEIDLNALEPLASTPHMPDKVKTLREIQGPTIQQVAIGSCTNSSINDLGIAADMLAGKTIHPNVSLAISPGSRQVLQSAMKAGIINSLVKSGARILENACGPCIGMGFAPASGGISLRTFNRNFKGRSGTQDAEVYLVSPETAAASALKGRITDPREIDGVEKKDYTSYIEPDNTMILPPASPEEAKNITVRRGPNIQPCPIGKPLQGDITTTIILKTGDNITTDDIMPAGAKVLPLRSNIPEISKHVFESLDPGFYDRAKKVESSMIIGGENYGQGSSREHAALAPLYLGIKIVIAKSFARIHRANLINFGILPLSFNNPEDYENLKQGDQILVTDIGNQLKNGREVLLHNMRNNTSFKAAHNGEARHLDIMLTGGLLNLIRKKAK